MQIDQFLARVVPPGNFLAVSNTFTRNDGGKGWSNRFFNYADIGRAANYLSYQAGKLQNDTYFALASYRTAIANGTDKRGNTKFIGDRKQVNTQQLRAFWIDMDVARPGDGKDPAHVYATRGDARRWLHGFLLATRLVMPNMIVDSGYGYHAYWLLEDPMLTAAWQPYAHAMQAAMQASGFKGDSGISIDAARVLRPPETYNMKSGQPVLVSVQQKYTRADYPNDLVLQALQPFVGAATVVNSAAGMATGYGVASASSALAGGGGNVQSIFAGRASSNMAAAMQANVSSARPRYFARIATECPQVGLSLTNHGKGEDRPLWYLGNMTLAVHCADGADYVHAFSDGDPRYVASNVDQHYKQAQAEHATKGNGPPLCTHYDRARPGVCQGCPHLGKVTTPWQTGIDASDDTDLPYGFQRTEDRNAIQFGIRHKDGVNWTTMLVGDVGNAALVELPTGGYALTFNYYREGKIHPVRATTAELKPDLSAIYSHFQGLNLVLIPGMENQWRTFLLSWIDKLRTQRAERTEDVQPFGWAINDGERTGLAIAGTVYRPDGTEDQVPGGDPILILDYKPSGVLAKWRQAADLVMAGRPDLQMIIAVAFGAPLMTFTGHSGVVFSAWSQQSAVGKSSAMRVARGVWAREATANALDDTNNAVLKRIGDTRMLPSFWDEMRGATKETSQQMVQLALSITQGKGKARLNSDSSMRDVGEWETILMCCSNYPLMDHILRATSGTDSGAARLFEVNITRPSLQDTSTAARTIQYTKFNYGHAGRVYAKWIAANLAKADKLVCAYKDHLVTLLAPTQVERFYIAGIACLLAGAKVANKLQLCAFDVVLLQDYLVTEFYRLRQERNMNTTVSAAGINATQILAEFVADSGANKLVTTFFAIRTGGRAPRIKPADIKWEPTDRSRVDVHISQRDQTIRIARSTFNDWCHRRGYPASAIVTAFQDQWHARIDREYLAAGTPYAPGRMPCIDIPALLPDLAGYLMLDPAMPPPAAPTPGNQPRV